VVIRSDWPLIGRRTELARIAELLGRSDVRGIVLAGTSGVGKTRLGDECLRLADAAGFSTARVSATRAAAAIPLGALSPLLPSLHDNTGADLLSRAAAALAERAAGRPLLLLVDDAHLLDDASAALLHQVCIDAGIFVVATLRNGEPVPDAVIALWKDGHAERLDIKPLGEPECDELINHVLGGSVDGGSLLALWKASEGIPLVLRELLLGAQEAGTLVEERGVWRLRGAPVASGRLLELIDARLAALDPTQRQALELIALGEPVPLAVLEACVGMAPLGVLEEKGFMEVREEGHRTTAWLVHPLHGEVLRRSMPSLRARTVRRMLAETTEATGARRREDLLRIATWRVESGAPGDPELLVAAGRQAYVADDYTVAEQLARAAVAQGGGVKAGHLLGQVLCEMGHRSEAEDVLDRTQALVDEGLTDTERALVAVTRSDNLFWGLARYDEAETVLRDIEAVVTDPDVTAQLVGQRASFEVMLGRVDEAVAMVEPMLDTAKGRAFVEACIVGEPALTFAGRSDQAVALAERGFAAHLELGDQMMTAHPGIHIVSQCLALNASGRVQEALPLAQFGYDAAAGVRRSAGQAWFSMILGTTSLTAGRLATAARWFREGAAIFGELGHHGHRWSLGGLGMACGMLGDADGAKGVLAELESAGPSQVLLSEPEVLRGRGWAELALGHAAESRAAFLEAVEVSRRTAQRHLELTSLHDLVRAGAEPGEVLDRMTELTTRLEGPLAPLRVRHVRAAAEGDGASLDAVAADYEALGVLLLAAEAAAEAVTAYGRDGQARRGEAAAVRSQQLAAACEGARTPALVLSKSPVPLTRREREVVVLAASGLASKAIADRLFLSVRTVDNHLQRAYTKLGVSGRDDLASVLDLLPPGN
jgi:DNA-binding CsgD family transcriptional regulator/tetratricopeptide (TPR) repeat protein